MTIIIERLRQLCHLERLMVDFFTSPEGSNVNAGTVPLLVSCPFLKTAEENSFE